MYVPNCVPIHPLTCWVWPISAGLILWGPSVIAQNPIGINLKVFEIYYSSQLWLKDCWVTYACINFRGPLPDLIMAPQKSPNFLAGIQNAPTVGFWFPLIKSGGAPKGEHKQRSGALKRGIELTLFTLLCSFHHEAFRRFKRTTREKAAVSGVHI